MRKLKFIFLLLYLFLSACGGADGTVSGTVDLSPSIDSTYTFSEPDEYSLDQYGEISITMSRSNEGNQPANSNEIEKINTGDADCNVSFENPSSDSPTLKLNNCTGRGILNVYYGYTQAVSVYVRASQNNYDLLKNAELFMNATGDAFIILDTAQRALVSLDLLTGVITPISNINVGAGTNLINPVSFALNQAKDTAYVVDSYLEGVYSINLATGNRTLVADGGAGTGVSLADIKDIVINNAETKAYLTDDATDAILELDIATGNRVSISDSGTGTGPALTDLTNIDYSTNDDKLFVVGTNSGNVGIYEVDLASGNRSLIANNTGSLSLVLASDNIEVFSSNVSILGYTLESFNSVTLAYQYHSNTFFNIGTGVDAPSYRMELSNDESKLYGTDDYTFVEIDLTTKQRSIKYSAEKGKGPNFSDIKSIIYNPNDNYLYVNHFSFFTPFLTRVDPVTGYRENITTTGEVIGSYYNMVLADNALYVTIGGANPRINKIDLNTNVISEVSSATTGTGPMWAITIGIAMNATKDTLYVSDTTDDAVYAVDVATGNRTLISQDGVRGTGSPMVYAYDLVVNDAEDTIYANDDNAIIAIDIATGNRTEISRGGSIGTGPSFNQNRDLEWNSDKTAFYSLNTRYWGTQDSFILKVDLATGNRTLITDNTTAYSGPILSWYSAMALEPNEEKIYAVGRDGRSVVEVDIATGDRLLLSK